MAISFYMGWDSLCLSFFVCSFFSFFRSFLYLKRNLINDFFDFGFFHFFDNFFHFINNLLDLFNNFLDLFDDFLYFFNFTLLSLIFAGFVKVLYKIRHIVVIVSVISSIISSVCGWYIRSQFL